MAELIINGMVFKGTIDELIELKRKLSDQHTDIKGIQQTKSVSNKPIHYFRIRGRGRTWTSSELKLLRQKVLEGTTYKELEKMFPNRTESALSNKVGIMGLQNRVIRKKHNPGQRNRMIKVHSIASTIRSRIPDMTFSEALKKAYAQVNGENGGKIYPKITEEEMLNEIKEYNKQEIYELRKYTLGIEGYKVINAYSSAEEVERVKEECESGDKTIGEHNIYYRIARV